MRTRLFFDKSHASITYQLVHRVCPCALDLPTPSNCGPGQIFTYQAASDAEQLNRVHKSKEEERSDDNEDKDQKIVIPQDIDCDFCKEMASS